MHPCIIATWFHLILYLEGISEYFPDSKIHGANMGPIWGRQDPGGPHVGPMNFAIWVINLFCPNGAYILK